MRLSRALALTLAAGLALPVAGHAATYDSMRSGTWSDMSIWNRGDGVPGVGDTVNVRNNSTVTLTSDTTLHNLAVYPGAELKLAGYNLTVDGLSINLPGAVAGTITSSSTAAIAVNETLDLADANITGANITVTPGLSGAVTFWGHASIPGTLTISGQGTVKFRPATLNDATPVLSVGTFTRTGSPLATGHLDWSLVQPPQTTTGPSYGDQVNLMSATGSVNGFTVVQGSDETVTATNTSVKATWISSTSTGAAPVNIAVPTVTAPAPPHPGDALTCTQGTWTNASGYTYAWTRDGVDVPNQSSPSYTVTSADVGSALGCSVVASGAGGTATARSAATEKVTHRPPANTAAPTLSGPSPVRAGDTLTCSQGTWSDATTYTYAWTLDGATIADESSATHITGANDAGHSVACSVTATGPGGSVAVASTPVAVAALPHDLLGMASGTGWKTAGRVDKLGVYTLPLAPADGWSVICALMTPTGGAMDTAIGKVGCSKDAITLVPTYPATGETTWRGRLPLVHGTTVITVPLTLTVTAGQAPSADAAPTPLAAANLGPNGVLTCGSGSKLTDFLIRSISQKQPSGLWGVFLVQFTGATVQTKAYWSNYTLLNYQSLLEASPTSFFAPYWQERIARLQQQMQEQLAVNSRPSVQACTQNGTGAATTNPVLSSGDASLTADATGNGDVTVTTANRASYTKMGTSREVTGTIAAGRTSRTKRTKRLNVPVAIVLLDRVGKGKKARMKGITLQVVGLTNGKTSLKLRKRAVVGTKTVVVTKNVTVNGVTKKVRTTVKVPKTITLSRHARLGIVMLQPIGKKLVPTIGTFPR